MCVSSPKLGHPFECIKDEEGEGGRRREEEGGGGREEEGRRRKEEGGRKEKAEPSLGVRKNKEDQATG